ncbi:MAG: ERCC4 domain-containing protein, partial [Candidatus Pacearchaeota archaeon]
MSFYNIFPKKQEKIRKEANKEIKIKILVDNREKNSLVPANLSKLNIPFEFTYLEVADYIVNDIAIERKTFSDFQTSIINKRILCQLENMKQYPKSLLIIEGRTGESQKILHENAI